MYLFRIVYYAKKMAVYQAISFLKINEFTSMAFFFHVRYHEAGGYWDAEDNCCEPKCSVDNPCSIGEGHCTANNQCEKVSSKALIRFN